MILYRLCLILTFGKQVLSEGQDEISPETTLEATQALTKHSSIEWNATMLATKTRRNTSTSNNETGTGRAKCVSPDIGQAGTVVYGSLTVITKKTTRLVKNVSVGQMFPVGTRIRVNCDENRFVSYDNEEYRGPPQREVEFTCVYDDVERTGSYWKYEQDHGVKRRIPWCAPIDEWPGLGPIECGPLQKFDGIDFISQVNPTNGKYKVGDAITLQCSDTSLILFPEGTERRRCQAGGTWEFNGGKTFCEKKVGCALPFIPDSINFTIDTSTCDIISGERRCQYTGSQYRPNVVVDFSCANDDEYIINKPRRTCTQFINGINWMPPIVRSLECRKKVACEAPLVRQYSFFTVVDHPSFTSFPPYTIITFKCISGYRLIGQKQLQCHPDGHWDSLSPVCVEEEYDGRKHYALLGTLFFLGLFGLIASGLLVRWQAVKNNGITSAIWHIDHYSKFGRNGMVTRGSSLSQEAALICQDAQRALDRKTTAASRNDELMTLPGFWNKPFKIKQDGKSNKTDNLRLLGRLMPFKSQRASSLGGGDPEVADSRRGSRFEDLNARLIPVASYISVESTFSTGPARVLTDEVKASTSALPLNENSSQTT
uniref:Sushi domain-containing protein n=1 Tax=Plectus sambesii TaxID=2011161 RepID=A0A914VWI8_9BILA